jgi:hypothetical protein
MFVFLTVERKLIVPRTVRLAYAAALVVACLGLLTVVFVRYGDPPSLARRAYRSFTGPLVNVTQGSSLNKRLLTLSNDRRIALWRVAWHDSLAHPWSGAGAGTYEQYYFRHRPTSLKLLDAHGLYIETLAELGPVGLLLLIAAFAIPLVAAVRARARPLVPAAASAYLAFLLHAGADWDWELPAIVLAALLCAVAVLVASRPGAPRSLGAGARSVALAASLALMGFSFLGLLGNQALSASTSATDGHQYARAERDARDAARLAPWSSQPWERLGDAQFLSGRTAQARRSYAEAIRLDPNDWNLWFDLSLASRGRARSRAAAEALHLNPLSPEIAADPSFYGLRRPKRQGHRP